MHKDHQIEVYSHSDQNQALYSRLDKHKLDHMPVQHIVPTDGIEKAYKIRMEWFSCIFYHPPAIQMDILRNDTIPNLLKKNV